MRIILKPLFDILTGNVAVMDNVIYNYLIMLVVGEIAFRVAWSFVGDLYRIGAIDGKASGSIIHWSIRLIAYVACAYIIRGGIWLYAFLVAVPHWIWWLVLGIFIAAALTIMEIFLFRNRKMRSSDDTRNKETN